MQAPPYVLVTAAFNEESYIEHTILAVVSQTHRPLRWVIVSDASTDQTEQIAARYAGRFEFIRLFRITEEHPRNFAAQVRAINTGVALLQDLSYEFIGNLDADVSMDAGYFHRLIERLRQDPLLGLGGGFIYDMEADGQFRNRKMNSVRSVAHAVQLFRRECFESTGAYLPLPYGGPDTHAEVSARMNGWRVQSFPDLKVMHYRPSGSAGGRLRSSFRQGLMDFSLGYHPLYEIAKLARRIQGRPFFLSALFRSFGFVYGYLSCERRCVSDAFVKFIRTEQRRSLAALFLALSRRIRVSSHRA